MTDLPHLPGSLASHVSAHSIRVLIIEDRELDARILVNLLRQGGYDVFYKRTARAEEMILLLRSQPWDAILCDHSMPGFSAPEALLVLQGTELDIPFIIVSAGIGEDVAVAAMKAGAHDFVIKGDLARLVPAVEREIREAGIRAARRKAEETLRESELRYRLVWENSADAVLLLDSDGLIRFANPAVLVLFGRTPESLVGQPLNSLALSTDDWWAEAKSQDRARLVDIQAQRPDGSLIDLDIAFRAVKLHDQRLCAAFARDITERKRHLMEIHRSREEFAAAREIQQRLFPKTAPSSSVFDIAGASYPADATGGDYYDYLNFADGRIGIVIADVSGHGIGPALLMAEARSTLRALGRVSSNPAEILTRANADLAEDLGGNRYITLLLVVLDPIRRELHFSSAGHPPGLVLAADGAVKAELRRTGPPLGQRSEYSYSEGTSVKLEAGDRVVLLTDGIIDASRGLELFGRQRVLSTLKGGGNGIARLLVDRLCVTAQEFSGSEPQADDITAVIANVRAA